MLAPLHINVFDIDFESINARNALLHFLVIYMVFLLFQLEMDFDLQRPDKVNLMVERFPLLRQRLLTLLREKANGPNPTASVLAASALLGPDCK